MFETLSSRAILGIMAAELGRQTPNPYVDGISLMLDGLVNGSEISINRLSHAGKFRKWQGPRQRVPMSARGSILTLDLLEATIGLRREDRRKDKTGLLRATIGEWVGNVVGSHWQDALVPLMLNGETSSTTYGTAATDDGLDFFVRAADTKHADSQYNVEVLASSASGTTTAQAESLLQACLMRLAGFTRGGKPVNDRMSSVAVIAPTSLIGPLAAALKLDLIQGTSGTRQNTLLATGSALGLQFQLFNEVRMLTADGWGTGSTKRFVMARTDSPDKAFIRGEAEAPTYSAKAEGSEYEHDTNEHEYGLRAVRGAGYGRWEFAVLGEFGA